MTRYLILWENDNSLLPTDPTELSKVFRHLLKVAVEDVESGRLKDWGVSAAGGFGYMIVEAKNEKDVYGVTVRYRPYTKTISITPVLNAVDVAKTFKAHTI